jgi:hypothetical protein
MPSSARARSKLDSPAEVVGAPERDRVNDEHGLHREEVKIAVVVDIATRVRAEDEHPRRRSRNLREPAAGLGRSHGC